MLPPAPARQSRPPFPFPAIHVPSSADFQHLCPCLLNLPPLPGSLALYHAVRRRLPPLSASNGRRRTPLSEDGVTAHKDVQDDSTSLRRRSNRSFYVQEDSPETRFRPLAAPNLLHFTLSATTLTHPRVGLRTAVLAGVAPAKPINSNQSVRDHSNAQSRQGLSG